MDMNSAMSMIFSSWEVLLVLNVTAIACSLIGIFLVLRKLSMISDAISHSVFLGIVLVFFVVRDLSSPWLIIGAATFGILTVYAIEMISNTGLVKHNDAVGIVFPLFFSLAVILITKYGRYFNLDLEVVLMGEVILSPLNQWEVFGLSLPKTFWEMGALLLANGLFIYVFYKELKVGTFDPEFATLIGFSSTFLFYGLMTMASLTAVTAFDAVGAILVISFLIAPPSSALLISNSLRAMIFMTIVYAVANSLLGYILSIFFNASMAGMTAFIAGLSFFITFLFHRHGPLFRRFYQIKNRQKRQVWK